LPNSRSHSDALRRPRLEALVDEAGARRLTSLIGGAGAGKTTLLLQWLGRKPAVWHTVTPADVSLSILARSILDKLRLQVPDLSPDLFLAVEGGRGPDSDAGASERADSLAAELCRELEARLSRHLYLVLDDLQALGRGGDSVRLIAALCRNAPERLHVIVASRTSLPYATSRMRLQGQAGEITADQLSFTVDEVAALLGAGGDGVDPETAQGVFDRTGGWPVAVALSARLDDPEGDGGSPGEDRATLFEYLAEEVIASERPGTLAALRTIAPLPWVTPVMASDLGIEREAADWFDTHRRSVYVMPAPNHPGAISLSPLVAEYVLGNHPLADDELRNLLLGASALYEREGAMSEAMGCLIRLGSAE
jgi:ATP/maltotriose-dependent transcriptional regulator MalT